MSSPAIVVLVHGIEDTDDKAQEASRVQLFERCFPDARVEKIDSFEGQRGLVDSGHLRRMAADIIDTLQRGVEDDDGGSGGDSADDNYVAPIVFFAHNVGGALVRQLLLLASEQQQYQWIMLRTVGLYIFDSAHQDWAGFMFANLSAGAIAPSNSCALVQVLPQAVAHIELQFRSIDGAFSTTCFSPDNPSKGSSSRNEDPWRLCDGDGGMYNVCVDAMSLLRQKHPRLQSSYHSLMRLLSGADSSTGRLGVVNFDPAHTTGLNNEHGSYRKWLEDEESRILVISGPSGSGQTYLSSQILHRLSAALRPEPQHFILSFAFDSHHIQRSSENDFLRAILRQLLILRPVLFGRMRQIASGLPRESHISSSQLRDLLLHLLSIPDQPRVFLIVTGLDQCKEQQSIAAFAERLICINRSGPVKILLSRSAELVDALSEPSTYRIYVDQADWREAIRESASEKCRHIVSMRPVWRGMEDSIVNKLCSGDYTYFGVMISLDQLERGSMPSTRQALSQLLMGPVWSLRLIFDSMTEEIRSEPDSGNSSSEEQDSPGAARIPNRSNLVRKAINWVFHAVRPLSTTELAVALALEEHSFPPIPSSNADSRDESSHILAEGVSWDILKDLGDRFTNMVKVVDDSVHLIHPMFRAYLQNKAGILIPDFQAFITEKLLSYAELFNAERVLSKDDRHLAVARSLIRYARLYWPEHYSRQLQPLAKLDQRVEEFLSSKPQSPFITASEDPFWIAAQMGFTRIVQRMLGTSVSPSDSLRVTRAAEFAAGRGHMTVLKLLMEVMSVNDILISSAINAASAYGHADTLRVLLAWAKEKKLDVAKILQLNTNSLTTAVAGGNTEVIQCLLSEGFEIGRLPPVTEDSDHEYANTAVHVASRLGNVEVLNILRHASDKGFRKAMGLANHDLATPLHLVCGAGISSAYRLVRAHSLDRLITGEISRVTGPKDPLVLAAGSGNLEIYDSCYRGAGAETIPSDIERAALVAAARAGHGHIVQRAVESLEERILPSQSEGKNPGENEPEPQHLLQVMQDDYRSAMEAAMEMGHLSIVHFLLAFIKRDTERDCDGMRGAMGCDRSTDILRAFKAVGASFGPLWDAYNPLLDLAIGNKDAATVRYLVEEGLRPQWDGTESSLHYAARFGRQFCVREMLRRATEDDLQKRSTLHRRTPLEEAAIWDELDVCREILAWQDKSAAASDLPSPRPVKILIAAIENGSERVVSYLLREKGWSANPANNDEGIPLHTAASGIADVKFMRLLLDKKALQDRMADINAHNEDKETALYVACREGHADKVKVLLDNGANQSLSDTHGLTPLHIALQNEREEVVRVLLGLAGSDSAEATSHVNTSKPNIEEETKDGWRAIHYAARSSELTKMLLSLGPRPSLTATIRETEMTPLDLAAVDSSLAVVQQLLEAGANPNSVSHEGWRPLHVIMRRDDEDLDMLRLLRRYGADPNAVDDDGRSPLYMAVRNDKVESALSLLQPQETDLACSSISTSLLASVGGSALHAKVNLYGGTLHSPLQAAASEGHTRLVKALLDAGANQAAEGGEFGSALHAALWGGRVQTVRLLLEHQDSGSHDSEANADEDATSSPADVNRLVRPLGSPLHALYGSTLAHEESAADCAALLLKHGADVNAKNYSGRSVVILAVCCRPDWELKGLLDLEWGVKIDVDHADANGLTALHYAAGSYSLELVKHLLQAGADPERRDRRGRSALYYAASRIHDDLYQAILAKLAPDSRKEHMNEALMASLRALGSSAFNSILQEEGIDINRSDRNGWRALDLTHEHVNPQMKEALEAKGATRGPKKQDPTRLCPEDCDSHITLSENCREAWISVGVAEDSMPLDSVIGWEQKSWGYHGDDGSIMSEGEVIHTGPTYRTGNVVGVTVDPGRRTLRFTRDGVTIGNSNPFHPKPALTLALLEMPSPNMYSFRGGN
ncbi:hypothetical protein S7711_06145 [Stachybotrys chartarum IBT 7711]|uniref:Protein SSH4 n=1 Tax=Stachybotrys chartarum (strain CBS 109288 / IBT 7711) TaxID=1280523 RepID=A0A084B693_STACB|nr:hypothetical protein S7711_06145 [Stachybotrys chartarum IBT 7711]